MLRDRAEAIRLALEGVKVNGDVRQVLQTMLDDAERELRSVGGDGPPTGP